MKTITVHGTYVGALAHLKGKTALLHLSERTQVLAQFDDMKATRDPELLASRPDLIWALSLGYGWHEFPAADFTVSPDWCLAVQRSEAMCCSRCDLSWDVNDPAPPACRPRCDRQRPLCTMSELWDELEARHGNQ